MALVHAVPPVVDASWLIEHHAAPDVRVLDVRWSLDGSGRAAFERSHVPGAVFLDLDTDLSAPTGPGRHPLPDAASLQRVFGRAGVDAATHVVAYDDAFGSVAARVWFLLSSYGHGRVSILDGGFRAWLEAGGPVATEVIPPRAGALGLDAKPGRVVVDKAHVAAALPSVARGRVLLLDARSGARYRGESEPVDARAGHIPGAKSAPWEENLTPTPDGGKRLRTPGELREHYLRLGAGRADEIVVYCGSGVTACLDLLALERAGFAQARLYEGSWSDWARDAELPAALGDD